MSHSTQGHGAATGDLIGIQSVLSRTQPHSAGMGDNQEALLPSSLANPEVEKNPAQRQTDELVLEHISGQRSKSFFLRNFSTVSRGGIRSSVFTLFSSAIGAGILSLPKVLSEYGVVLGAVSLLVFGGVSYRMHTIVWELAEGTGRKSYANLFALYFGKVAPNFNPRQLSNSNNLVSILLSCLDLAHELQKSKTFAKFMKSREHQLKFQQNQELRHPRLNSRISEKPYEEESKIPNSTDTPISQLFKEASVSQVRTTSIRESKTELEGTPAFCELETYQPLRCVKASEVQPNPYVWRIVEPKSCEMCDSKEFVRFGICGFCSK